MAWAAARGIEFIDDYRDPGVSAWTGKNLTKGALGRFIADIGSPDYGDEGMLQYLRAERIVPPYQTRGYKIVELVRIYEAGTPRRE